MQKAHIALPFNVKIAVNYIYSKVLASKRNFLLLISFLGVLAISLELSGSVTGYTIAKASTTIAIILYAASNRGISRMSAQWYPPWSSVC